MKRNGHIGGMRVVHAMQTNGVGDICDLVGLMRSIALD